MVVMMRVAFRRSITGRRAENTHCFVEEEEGKESRKDCGLQRDSKIRSVAALPSLSPTSWTYPNDHVPLLLDQYYTYTVRVKQSRCSRSWIFRRSSHERMRDQVEEHVAKKTSNCKGDKIMQRRKIQLGAVRCGSDHFTEYPKGKCEVAHVGGHKGQYEVGEPAETDELSDLVDSIRAPKRDAR
jgi:hypothetical protein